MSEWQPIETVPVITDFGTGCEWTEEWFLLFVPDEYGGMMIVGSLEADEWIYRDAERACGALHEKPTHWMPLPPPPRDAHLKAQG